MKLNRLFVVIAALCFTAAAATFAANAHTGTLKLDESKSKMGADSPNNQTVIYTESDGTMMLTVDGVDKDGKAIHWTWKGKFDGKQEKVGGNDKCGTIGYKATNDHTDTAIGLKDGKVVFTGRIKASEDGKSRMVTTTMKGAGGKKHTDKSYYTKE